MVLCDQLTTGGEVKLEAMEMLEVQELTVDQCWAAAREQPASSFLTLGLLWLTQAGGRGEGR